METALNHEHLEAQRWEIVNFPAIAEYPDEIGRQPGDPLYSPLLNETTYEAVQRWNSIKTTLGSYTFDAMYQQHPSSPKGAIFETHWWRFWTHYPEHASDDGRVIFLEPDFFQTHAGLFIDSWDATFKGTENSDYVVGQRWTHIGANRYLLAQRRGRMSFTETQQALELWANYQLASPSLASPNPYGDRVTVRLIEEAANGAALIDSLRWAISGIIPTHPRVNKVERARPVTPAIESGNVFLPYPGDPGNEWVDELLNELRAFPTGAFDDQVDSLTQALAYFQDATHGSASASLLIPRGLGGSMYDNQGPALFTRGPATGSSYSRQLSSRRITRPSGL